MNRRTPATTDRESIKGSAPFLAYVQAESTSAQRRADDAQAQIEQKRQAIARSLADHETFAQATELEIADLLDTILDEGLVIDAAARALRPAPQLTPVKNVISGEDNEHPELG